MSEFDEAAGPRFHRSGRLGRLVKMGGLAAQVAGSTVARRIGGAFKGEEARASAAREGLVDNAQKVVRTMGELKGAAMKLGQMLSVAPEALPREFLEELRSLQKDSPAMPYDLVAEQISTALHRPLHEIFRFFDPVPLGAASIGQVHKARLFDGREVAVKVQYPGIAATLESDLKNLSSMLVMVRVVADRERIEATMDEVRRGILEEADYLREADNLEAFGAVLEQHPKIVVPKVLREYSSANILTMTHLEGEKLDVALDRLESAEEKDRVGFDFSEIFVWMFHHQQVLHADPHPGNFLLTPEGKYGLLDFGCMRRYDQEFTDLWLDLLVAKWSHQKARLPELHERLGFGAKRGSDGLSAEQLNELMEIVLAPFLYDRTFDWGSWDPKRGVERFVRTHPSILRYGAPPRAIFYFRVCAGIWGFLQRCRVRGNWYRLARGVAEARGRL